MDEKIIEVADLTKDYGFGRGVFDVSFHVGISEVFGFLGPNGAGKSTTIRHLMGFSKPDSGSTKIFGKETFNNYSSILNNVGYIPGEIALPAGLTGDEFLKMMMDMQHCKDDSHLKKLIKIFELDPSGETKRMSLGVKRKLAVVTAFMNDPDVLIMDEPTSGLDPEMQQVFIDYVKEEKRRGKTILLSSHIFSEVDATCDRIAIIKDGRIVSDFIADDLKHSTRKEYEITFEKDKEYREFIASVSTADFMELLGNTDNRLQVRVATEDKDINKVIAALAGYEITGLHHRKETLEDYFMSYYKEDKEYGGAFAG